MVIRDEFWVGLRAVLMVGGGFLAGRGYATMEDVAKLADNLPTVINAMVAVGTAAWAMWVRLNTRAVPIETAKREDVPTVSPATGAYETGATVTKETT